MVESFRQGATLVKLILRNKEFEVKPGMTLLSALQKVNIIPESVIATRDGEMILDDEILKDGDVVKLVAVISGGSVVVRISNYRISGIEHEM
jgi:sulfur carrier protein